MSSKTHIVDIETLGRRGDGIGRLDGQPVYVPRAVPGDRLRLKVRERRGGGLSGQIIEQISTGAGRQDPPCPYFGDCGSCSLQHLADDYYRNWKRNLALEPLQRAGTLPDSIEDPVFIPPGTRRRATLAAFKQHKRLWLGYHRARSHDILDIPDCLMLSPRLRDCAGRARPFLFRILTDSRPADIFVQDVDGAIDMVITGPVGSRKQPGLAEREAIAEMVAALGIARLSWRLKDRDLPEIMLQPRPVLKRAGKIGVPLPPAAFLQPGAEGESALAAAVMDNLPNREQGRFADLFAGCGTFAGRMLARGDVLAVEGDEAASADLAQAAGQVPGLRVMQRDLFRDPLSGRELEGFDGVVLDPPRAGARAQAEELAGSGVPVIVYVSCNPASFARDAQILTAGGYRFTRLHIIDQFVWSAHLEIVGVFYQTCPMA